jgi:hypothetical protein
MNQDHTGDIILYQTEDGTTRIEVRFENDNIWLTQQQMAELYQTSRTNVVEHIKHIIEEGELMESSTCRKFRQVQQEGKRQVERELPYYNLDMIISLGYRIKSRTATKFRIWATERLKDYLVKGYSLDDERLKQAGGGGYWYELLNQPMFMGDHIAQLDKILSATGEPILTGAGNISHKKAIDKAKLEFKKFQLKTISPVESAYLDNIRALQKKIDKNAK